jgi:Flp pilus assembly protein TadD
VSQDLFDEAVRLEEEGQYEPALAVWQQLAESSPTRNVFLRLGSITKDLGHLGDAERAFKRALEIDGRSANALMSLGSLAIDQRNYEKAVDFLRRACEIQEDPGGFTLLGVALENTGELSDAEAAYRSAIRIDPKYEEAYYNLGVLLRDRPSEAQALLMTALELDPVYACAHRELGFLMSKRAPDAQAETHLRKAIELDSNDAWAHVYLGTHLWRCSEIEAAVKEFSTARDLAPEWVVPLWSLGNIYESESMDLDLAQSLFERVLLLEPDDWSALKGLARIFEKRGQTDLAREYMTRAMLQDPGSEEAL